MSLVVEEGRSGSTEELLASNDVNGDTAVSDVDLIFSRESKYIPVNIFIFFLFFGACCHTQIIWPNCHKRIEYRYIFLLTL